jgi:hypothetical protein
MRKNKIKETYTNNVSITFKSQKSIEDKAYMEKTYGKNAELSDDDKEFALFTAWQEKQLNSKRSADIVMIDDVLYMFTCFSWTELVDGEMVIFKSEVVKDDKNKCRELLAKRTILKIVER